MQKINKNKKYLPASQAHSHRTQFASLACLSAPRARGFIFFAYI